MTIPRQHLYELLDHLTRATRLRAQETTLEVAQIGNVTPLEFHATIGGTTYDALQIAHVATLVRIASGEAYQGETARVEYVLPDGSAGAATVEIPKGRAARKGFRVDVLTADPFVDEDAIAALIANTLHPLFPSGRLTVKVIPS